MLSENQNQYVMTDNGMLLGCKNCDAAVLFNADGLNLVFTCDCGEVDADKMPEWLKGELS
jgi:hypothetical protein